LMLGEQFDESDPWVCILRSHGLSCERDAFLGALNSAGEAVGCRALIIVDAINEGVGVSFWNKHLASILTHLRHFPYLSFAVTVRKSICETGARLGIEQLRPLGALRLCWSHK
jgi:hypothetical protein